MNPDNSQPPVLWMREVTIGAQRDARHPVLTGVNWRVNAGEFWVLAGGQQAGKTDLLMTAAGLIQPVAGSYELFGRESRDLDETGLAERLRVALVFEQGQLFNHLTLVENIALPLRYHQNLAAAEAVNATLQLLEWLELTPFAEALPARLSREWLKRAALARALVLRPRVLLCDNPLNGLGARHRQWWVKFLDQLGHGQSRLGGEAMTVVVTADDLAPWQQAERRLALLHDGQFSPLGNWAEAGRSTHPAAGEWLASGSGTTI